MKAEQQALAEQCFVRPGGPPSAPMPAHWSTAKFGAPLGPPLAADATGSDALKGATAEEQDAAEAAAKAEAEMWTRLDDLRGTVGKNEYPELFATARCKG